MSISPTPWHNTTHDWAQTVDTGHLATIRGNPTAFAPTGVLHLVLEVLAYAADEAESTERVAHCTVGLHQDGSVSVRDDGRGTDTRRNEQGEPVKKPVMATKDLRFFDFPDAEQLPDAYPRRGMSVVAALSSWLVHTNRRLDGSWTQRYEHGIPVTGLVPLPEGSSTGTTVHFLPDASIDSPKPALAAELLPALAAFPQLAVEIVAAPR